MGISWVVAIALVSFIVGWVMCMWVDSIAIGLDCRKKEREKVNKWCENCEGVRAISMPDPEGIAPDGAGLLKMCEVCKGTGRR